MFIPAGFAHGFLCLENETIFTYKCSAYYNSESEAILAWNDPDLAIDWEVNTPMISERDAKGERFSTFNTVFE